MVRSFALVLGCAALVLSSCSSNSDSTSPGTDAGADTTFDAPTASFDSGEDAPSPLDARPDAPSPICLPSAPASTARS